MDYRLGIRKCYLSHINLNQFMCHAREKVMAGRSRPTMTITAAYALGSNTASITWITPFEVSMSALTTLALSIFTPSVASIETV